MQIAIGIVLIIAALFLIVAVLMQHGKSHNLSGAIAGGAETFFGKEKGSTVDKKLSKLTTIVAIVFALLVLVSYFMQDTVSNYTSSTSSSDETGDVIVDDTDTDEIEDAGEAEDTVSTEDGEAEVTEP